MISQLNIFGFIFDVDLVTLESLWRYKGVAMHMTYKTMTRHLPLRNFAFSASLCIKTK